jgi:hypothetical protein
VKDGKRKGGIAVAHTLALRRNSAAGLGAGYRALMQPIWTVWKAGFHYPVLLAVNKMEILRGDGAKTIKRDKASWKEAGEGGVR